MPGLRVGDRLLVGLAKEDVAVAAIAMTDLGSVGGDELIPELRTLEAECHGTIAHGQLRFHEGASSRQGDGAVSIENTHEQATQTGPTGRISSLRSLVPRQRFTRVGGDPMLVRFTNPTKCR
jgi:hypothetical protein